MSAMPRMKNSPLDREIRARIDSLLTDISQLVKRSALDSVRAAFGADAAGAAPTATPRRGPGRPRKDAAAAPAARAGKRAKRSSEDVQATADKFLAHVKANPGQSTEQIGKALGMATKELQLPVVKLVQSGAVRTEGQKRGTKYFAGGGKRGKRGKRAKKA